MTKTPILQSLKILREKRSADQDSGISNRPDSAISLSRTTLVLMLAISAITLFFGLSSYKTFSSHEIFTAVGAREMIETGDYIVPHQAGLPRLKKPPLGYWVIVGVAKITGRVDEFSSRLPAAIAAGLLCLLTGVWASRWYGRNAGIFAAFAQATMAFVILYSRKSEVDMCLTLFNTAAMFLIVFQPAGQTWKAGFVRWLGIFALLGLSTMSKFHYGPAMVLVPCAVYWSIQRRWNDFKHTLNPVGWLLWLGPICLWIGLVVIRIPNALEIWRLETIGRALGELPPVRPIWFYFGPLLWMTLPWTVLWLREVPRSWNAAVKDGNVNERFLWCWLLTHFVIVSLQPDRHPQYLLSALPLFALWTGRRLSELHQSQVWMKYRWTRSQAVLISAGVAAGAIAVAWVLRDRWPWMSGWGNAVGLVLGIGGLSATWFNHFGKPGRSIACLGVTACGLLICGLGGIVPARDHWRAQAEFSERVQAIAGERPISGYKLDFSPLFYLGPALQNFKDDDDFRAWLEQHNSLLLVAQERHLESLEQFGQLEPVTSMTETERKLAGNDHPIACWKLTQREDLEISNEPDSRVLK